MTFTTYLKAQLADFVDSYKSFFWKTFGITLLLTVACFIIMSLLFALRIHFSFYKPMAEGLSGFIFFGYSSSEVYDPLDWSKIFFIFFVALFSVALLKSNEDGKDKALLKHLTLKDVIFLMAVLTLCMGIDMVWYRLEVLTSSKIQNAFVVSWLRSVIFKFRIYGPLILNSIIIYKLITGNFPKLDIKKILFMFVSLWLFNEFAYEVYMFMRYDIFRIILAPFDDLKRIVIESILAVPLIAFYFIGYYSAMANPLKLMEEGKSSEPDL